MTDNQTSNLKINYLYQNQASADVIINEGFLKIDTLLNNSAISKSTTTPPTTPQDANLYIVPASATGAWLGQTNKIAYYYASKNWQFISPNEGMSFWIADENKNYTYDGSNWILTIDKENTSKLGINSTADNTNRFSVNSDAVLFNHNGTNSQVKVNKNSSSNNASHLFQNNFSGRAEFGLTGDDDFHIKTSSDGSNWNEALVIEASGGIINAKKRLDAESGISFNNGTNILNAYSTGTFTPVLYGSTTAGSPTYSFQQGKYTRIGNICIARVAISWTALGSATGEMRISGLPFLSYNDVLNQGFASTHFYSSLSLPAGKILTAYVDDNSDIIRLLKADNANSANSTALTDTEASATGTIYLTCIYEVA
jgi:hypothetical protein